MSILILVESSWKDFEKKQKQKQHTVVVVVVVVFADGVAAAVVPAVAMEYQFDWTPMEEAIVNEMRSKGKKKRPDHRFCYRRETTMAMTMTQKMNQMIQKTKTKPTSLTCSLYHLHQNRMHCLVVIGT